MGEHHQYKIRVLNPYPRELTGPMPLLLSRAVTVVRNCQLLLRNMTHKALDRHLPQHRQLLNVPPSLSCAPIMATFSRNMCSRNLRFLLAVLQTAIFYSRKTSLPRDGMPPCLMRMGNMSYMTSAALMELLSMDSNLKSCLLYTSPSP